MRTNNVSSGLFHYAMQVGLKMSDYYINDSEYYPRNSWGCEGQIYPSQMGLALLNLYKIEGNELFLRAVRTIIEKNIEKQMPSGGWPLLLGATGNGSLFEVSKRLIHLTSQVEDLPPTAVALRLLAEYATLTGDESYIQSMDKGYEFLTRHWNENKGAFNEMLTGEALKLRANPDDYLIYSFQAVSSLSRHYQKAEYYISPLYSSLKRVFEDMNEYTYPLLYAMLASMIVQVEGKCDYTLGEVQERIIEHIALKSKFNIPGHPGALGHHDGLRGIHLDEGHIRNSVGAALAMKFYDIYVEPDRFTSTDFYRDLQKWILGMYEEGLFYEFMDVKNGEKLGVGTPGQFIPIQWIIGAF